MRASWRVGFERCQKRRAFLLFSIRVVIFYDWNKVDITPSHCALRCFVCLRYAARMMLLMGMLRGEMGREVSDGEASEDVIPEKSRGEKKKEKAPVPSGCRKIDWIDPDCVPIERHPIE